MVLISSHVHPLIPLGLNGRTRCKNLTTHRPPPRTRQCKVIAPLSLAIRHCGHDTSAAFSPPSPANTVAGLNASTFRASKQRPPFHWLSQIQGWPTGLALANSLTFFTQAREGQRRPTTRQPASHVLTSPAFRHISEAALPSSPLSARRLAQVRQVASAISNVHLQALLPVSLVAGCRPLRR
jgi:hypothetical protein